MYENKMELNFLAKSENEAFARVAVAAFVAQLNPTLSDITEIKTAVSEAVTNAIIHGYEANEENANANFTVNIKCRIVDREVTIEISDSGGGIEDIEQAKEPLYTSKPEMERSGMGFTIMEEFMDGMEVVSEVGCGTSVKLWKKVN